MPTPVSLGPMRPIVNVHWPDGDLALLTYTITAGADQTEASAVCDPTGTSCIVSPCGTAASRTTIRRTKWTVEPGPTVAYRKDKDAPTWGNAISVSGWTITGVPLGDTLIDFAAGDLFQVSVGGVTIAPRLSASGATFPTSEVPPYPPDPTFSPWYTTTAVFGVMMQADYDPFCQCIAVASPPPAPPSTVGYAAACPKGAVGDKLHSATGWSFAGVRAVKPASPGDPEKRFEAIGVSIEETGVTQVAILLRA